MENSTLMALLKADLDLLTVPKEREAYLMQQIEAAKSMIQREGITLTDTPEDTQLVVMYAAWLYRKRNTGEGMPRMIRYALNNRVISQRGQGV